MIMMVSLVGSSCLTYSECHSPNLAGGRSVTDEPLHILLIEDNPGDRQLVRAYMSKINGRRPVIDEADRIGTGLERLVKGGIDLVLLDLSLPDSTGLDTFRKIHEKAPKLPIIVLTALDVQGQALDALKLGAEDYLIKGQIDSNGLVRSIRFALERARRRELERQLADVAADERGRIGRELHENLGQILTGLTLMAKSLEQKLAARSAAEADYAAEMADLAKESLAQVRDLARGLVPVEMLDEGLMVALEELAHRTTVRFGHKCVFECGQEIIVKDNKVATHLFHIAQEAVSNAIKHSAGNRVAISLSLDNGRLILRVKDNGVGFGPDTEAGAGLGQRIMRYRASMIGATIDITAEVGSGTLVRCALPEGTVTT